MMMIVWRKLYSQNLAHWHYFHGKPVEMVYLHIHLHSFTMTKKSIAYILGDKIEIQGALSSVIKSNWYIKKKSIVLSPSSDGNLAPQSSFNITTIHATLS